MNRGPQWPWRPLHTPPAVLAHRGGQGPHRENTLAAFTDALSAGAAGVELDVRRTADGVAVVHHDPAVPGAGLIHEVAAGDLPSWVPTLADALAACAGAVVDVEIKGSPAEPGHDPAETLAAEVAVLVEGLDEQPGAPRAVLISSFWPATLAAVRAACPGMATGLLVHPALDAGTALAEARALGCTTLLPFRSQAGPALVDECHGTGLAVVVWTVNEDADIQAVVAAGADGLVTDRVRLAVALVGASLGEAEQD